MTTLVALTTSVEITWRLLQQQQNVVTYQFPISLYISTQRYFSHCRSLKSFRGWEKKKRYTEYTRWNTKPNIEQWHFKRCKGVYMMQMCKRWLFCRLKWYNKIVLFCSVFCFIVFCLLYGMLYMLQRRLNRMSRDI